MITSSNSSIPVNCSQRWIAISFVFLLNLFLHSSAESQFDDFSNICPIYLSSETSMYGSGMSVYDFNEDGWDDITIAEYNTGIGLYENNGNGFSLVYFVNAPNDIKQVIWVDADNDGDPDLFYTANDMGTTLLRNDGDYNFVDQSASFNITLGAFPCGASWGDYNRDGLLDVFVCAYNLYGETGLNNFLFQNQGNFQFVDVAPALGLNVSSSVAFQPCWIDFDHDGWLDLYIINDHSEPNEFHRNINGTAFESLGEINGSDITMNSMTNSITDYDNDGDYDIFVTDSFYPALLQNNNGIFTDVTEQAGLYVSANSWAGLWIDFNLDGFDDLHICTQNTFETNFFYANQTDGSFLDYHFESYMLESYVSAKGDFDNDNRWDYAVLSGNPSSIKLFRNKSPQTHAIKLLLTGTVSNHDGVGSSIEYFLDDQRFITQTQCGENYLGQNTQYELLGTAEHLVIDSLFIHWPGGWVDRYYQLPSDSNYTFVEGETISSWNSTQTFSICPNDSIMLEVPTEQSVLWSDGNTSATRWIFNGGVFTATITNEFGLQYMHEFVVNELNTPSFEFLISPVSCYGDDDGAVMLVNQSAEELSINWNNQSGDEILSNLPAGEVEWQINYEDICSVNGTVLITQPEPLQLTYNDTLYTCYNGVAAAEVLITGGTPQYAYDWNGDDQNMLQPGAHAFTITDINGCWAEGEILVIEHDQIFVETIVEPFCENESTSVLINASGGAGTFEFEFIDFDPQFLMQGQYAVVVTDENACSITHNFEVEPNPTPVVNYTTTNPVGGSNGSISLNVSDGTAPYTYMWNNGDQDAIAENLSQGFYECLVIDAVGCTALFSTNLIDLSVAEKTSLKRVYPTVFRDRMTIESNEPDQISVYDVTGELIRNFSLVGTKVLDTAGWPTGSYVISFRDGSRSLCFKVDD